VNEDLLSDASQPPSTSGMEATDRVFNPHGAASLNELFSSGEVDQAINKMQTRLRELME